MSDEFDPYYQWLAIAPEEQPPTLYRLLGVRPFEDDVNVLETAADQRMTHLRTFQSGKYSEQSQKLLNEISTARLVLTDPTRRSEYDTTLREVMDREAEGKEEDKALSSALFRFLELEGAVGEAVEQPAKKPEGEESKQEEPKKPKKAATVSVDGKKLLILVGGAASLILLLIVVGVWALVSGDGNEPAVTSKPPEKLPVPPPPPPELSPESPMAEGLSVDLGGGVKMEFILIHPGEFLMGSSDQVRQELLSEEETHESDLASQNIPTEIEHRVTISKPFYLSKYEVTQQEWWAVTGNNPSVFKGPTNPVERVSWNDCQDFIAKLNAAAADKGLRFALPTEAQWEYACRAGTSGRFHFDSQSQLGEYGWIGANSDGTTHPVGQKRPNAWGLYDMHGNVAEWCADWFGNSYTESPSTDPVGPSSGSARVRRGGCWKASAVSCRSAAREGIFPNVSHHSGGLRVACWDDELAGQPGIPIATTPPESPTEPPTEPIPPIPPTSPEPPTDAVAVHSPVDPPPSPQPPEPAAPPSPPTVAKKVPIPSEDIQRPFAERIADVYEAGAKTDPEKIELAKKLFLLGRQSQGNAAEKFVLMRRAMELATAGGDAELMLGMIDGIGENFVMDPLVAKGKKLRSFAEDTHGPIKLASLVRASNRYIGEAMAAERFDFALSIARLVEQSCRRSYGKDYRRMALDQRREVERVATEHRKFQEAIDLLKADPANSSANLLVGRTYCFERDDWQRGLPCLAKGDDPRLAALARKELASPADPQRQVDLADGWWAAAEDCDGHEKEAMRLRAAHWYGIARPKLQSSLTKDTVDRRLAEIGKIQPPVSVGPTQPPAHHTPTPGPPIRRPSRTAKRWDTRSVRLLWALEGHSDTVRDIAFGRNDTILASASWDGTVKLWDIATGRLARTLVGHEGRVHSVAVDPNGSLVASGGNDKIVRLWDLGSGRAERTLEGHVLSVSDVAFHPKGTLVASGSLDKTLKVWNPATGRLRNSLEGHFAYVTCVAFSPDGSTLASGSVDRTIKIWDVATGRLRQTLAGHDKQPESVAFSPDGTILASGGRDKIVKLWDLASGQLRRTLQGHKDIVNSVAFSPDGSMLASASNDKSVRIWNGATGELGGMLGGHASWVGSVAFSRDGSMLASGSADRMVRVWKFAEAPAGPRRPGPPPDRPRGGDELTLDFGGVKMELVLVPPGEFTMGSPDVEQKQAMHEAKVLKLPGAVDTIPTEGPRHRVRITQPFFLGKYEVTQAQWQAVMGNNPSRFKNPMNPVEQVSWIDCQSFVARLNKELAETGLTFSLPTEAQWEHACRAGGPMRFGFGDDAAALAHHGWFKTNSKDAARPVGQRRPNTCGLYDMHGNVWEWCADWYGADYYRQLPLNNPAGPPVGTDRVVRGGAWNSPPMRCRSATRFKLTPSTRDQGVGFRVMCSRTGIAEP